MIVAVSGAPHLEWDKQRVPQLGRAHREVDGSNIKNYETKPKSPLESIRPSSTSSTPCLLDFLTSCAPNGSRLTTSVVYWCCDSVFPL